MARHVVKPPKADMDQSVLNVRFVPIAAVSGCSKQRLYSITSSAVASNAGGNVSLIALAVFRLMTCLLCP